MPKGMGTAEVGSRAALDSWLAAAAHAFPAPTQVVKSLPDADQELYAEPGDMMRNPCPT